MKDFFPFLFGLIIFNWGYFVYLKLKRVTSLAWILSFFCLLLSFIPHNFSFHILYLLLLIFFFFPFLSSHHLFLSHLGYKLCPKIVEMFQNISKSTGGVHRNRLLDIPYYVRNSTRRPPSLPFSVNNFQ